MGGAAAAEMVPLDDALEALADRRAGDVDLLAGDEMVGSDLGADVEKVLGRNPELGDLGLRLDRSRREMAAQRLRRVLHLGEADAQLNGGIAVLLLGALRHDLAVLHAEHRDRHMLARVVVDARHADFLCDNT